MKPAEILVPDPCPLSMDEIWTVENIILAIPELRSKLEAVRQPCFEGGPGRTP